MAAKKNTKNKTTKTAPKSAAFLEDTDGIGDGGYDPTLPPTDPVVGPTPPVTGSRPDKGRRKLYIALGVIAALVILAQLFG